MSIPPDVQAALERLTQYNSLPYNRDTNPHGLPYPGYVTEFPRALSDAAIVAIWIGETGGLPGDPIELGRTLTHIVWRYVGTPDWIDLVALIDITGDEGPPGPANTLAIGTVERGPVAGATITGIAPNQTLNLTLPEGDKGNDGDAATISVGTVTSVPNTAPATVTNVGTSAAAVFNFELPSGKDGDGAGDMLAATYDPTGKAASAFDMANMSEATDAKVMTAAERAKLAGIEDGADKTPDLADVATSGSYNDLSDKPAIPSQQVNSDWGATEGLAEILNKPTLGSLAAKSKVGISDIDATGTPSAQTFLNGAGGWETPAGGGDVYFQVIRSVVPTGAPAVTITDIDDDEVMLFVDGVEHDGTAARNISISLSTDKGATFTVLGNSSSNQVANSPVFLLFGMSGLLTGVALVWGGGVPYAGEVNFPAANSQAGRAIMRSQINAIQIGLSGAGNLKSGIGAVKLLARRPAP